MTELYSTKTTANVNLITDNVPARSPSVLRRPYSTRGNSSQSLYDTVIILAHVIHTSRRLWTHSGMRATMMTMIMTRKLPYNGVLADLVSV